MLCMIHHACLPEQVFILRTLQQGCQDTRVHEVVGECSSGWKLSKAQRPLCLLTVQCTPVHTMQHFHQSREALHSSGLQLCRSPSPSPRPFWQRLHPGSAPRYPSPDSRGASPGRALHSRMSKLDWRASMHASKQALVRSPSPRSIGRSQHILCGASEEAPEIAEIDARLQALQAFLKEAREGSNNDV